MFGKPKVKPGEDNTDKLLSRPWYFKLAALFSALIVALGLSLIMSYADTLSHNWTILSLVWPFGIVAYLLFIFMLWHVHNKIVNLAHPRLWMTDTITKKNLGYLGIGLIGWFLMMILLDTLGTLLPNLQPDIVHTIPIKGWEWVSYFIFNVCLAPVVEELIARGWFGEFFFLKPDWFTKWMSQHSFLSEPKFRMMLCIVLSAFFSSMPHAVNATLFNAFFLFNGGMCMWIYLKTRRIVYPIAYHIFNNLVTLVVAYFTILH